MSQLGLVSRVTPVRDGGGPFEFGNQVLISSHRKLLSSKATVVLCQEDARAVARFEQILAALRTRVVCAGWSVDEAAAQRTLKYLQR
jgi:hypothetical protein